MKNFFKLVAAISLAVCLCVCPFFMGNARVVSAEDVEITLPDSGESAELPEEDENTPAEPAEPPVTNETPNREETGAEGLQTLVDGFLAQLKAKYGEDYEAYYNAILADWGSVEEYLLSLIKEDTPDQIATGWTAFVRWLGEYSPVWGSILAVALVLVVIIFGKKSLNKVVNWATGANGKFKTLFAEINKIDAAQAAQNSALIKLLGENEKFKEERKALQNSAEEMKNDGGDL